MAETLQRKLACDKCGSSDLTAFEGHSEAVDWMRIVFLCRFLHRTEVRVRRAVRQEGDR